MLLDKIIEGLRDDRNSIDKFIEIFANHKLIPQILEKQDIIIDLLKKEKQGGMSPDFRALLLRDIATLQGLGETTNSKGKEEISK